MQNRFFFFASFFTNRFMSTLNSRFLDCSLYLPFFCAKSKKKTKNYKNPLKHGRIEFYSHKSANRTLSKSVIHSKRPFLIVLNVRCNHFWLSSIILRFNRNDDERAQGFSGAHLQSSKLSIRFHIQFFNTF